jgi:hypothetical protein
MDGKETAVVRLLIERLLEKLDKLQIPSAVFMGAVFHEESDWSFVIRLHTVVEASMNERILTALGDERLYSIISRLDIADQTRGKLAYCKALNLLPEECRSFVKWFAELRNALVHHAKNLDFSIETYLTEDFTLRTNFTKCLRKIFPSAELGKLMETDPRHGIFLGALAVMVVEPPAEIPPPSESNPKES